jgi:hypothetical protein
MRARTVLVGVIASGLLLACNFIVANKFEGTDGYSRDGGSSGFSSSSSSGTSGTITRDEPCSLEAPDGGEQCRDCIQEGCPAELDDACDPDPEGGRDQTETWWGRAKQCAATPYNGGTERYSWGCDAFESLDAGPLPGDTPTARERRFMLCIRDKCVSGPTPPCKQCIIKHDTTAEEVLLENSECGKCIRAQCEPGLVKCCNNGVVITEIPGCAYENGPGWEDCLQNIWSVDAGTTNECDRVVHVCIQENCASVCPKP